MAYVKVIRCNRCGQPCRNDGTETEPKWVCNDPKCVKYKPPVEPETNNGGE